jgi:hypothetical protein
MELSPGQRVVLPILSAGTVPLLGRLELARVVGPGFPVDVRGVSEPRRGETDIEFVAGEDAELDALGIRAQLAPGERAILTGLARGAAEPAPEPVPQPAPGEEPVDPAAEATEATAAKPAQAAVGGRP